jgi:Fe-S-cluster containining protein
LNTKIESRKLISDDPIASQALPTEQQLTGYKLAEQKIEMLIQENPWIAPKQLERSFTRIMGENASTKSKRRKTIEIVDSVTTALAPYVACKKGCSSCCKMNTMIYEHEAAHLAEITGRKMLHLPYRPLNEVFKKGKDFNGKPCPFLVNDACSVYEDRPIVCRTHHSLFDDATSCSMDDPSANKFGPPMYDPDLLETPYLKLNAKDWPTEPWGNIREFFPEG